MHQTTKRILAQVLEKVTPTPTERKGMENAITKSTAMLETMIKGTKLTYTLAGSFIRDTWMRDKKEFEIFMMFPEDTPRDVLEREGLELGKTLTDRMHGAYRVAYAEHPYVRANIMGFDVDIVPCYKLASANHIKSAVDRTPFHNKWISANLKPKQSKEVRLLKQFAKAHGIYGSDTKTLGLSGYLCELLVVHYGSFMGFIEAAACWKAGKVLIDMERRYKRSEDAFFNKRFKDQPLIVIDPVDGERNVAAVMSHGNFEKLVRSAASFLEKPSLSAFFPPKIKVNHTDIAKRVKSRRTNMIVVRFSRPDVIDDVLWPQLRRTAQRLENIMKEYEFGVVGHDVHADGECVILLELDKWKLPKLRRLQGPGVFAKERVDEFTKKYKGVGKVWQEKGIMFAEVPRTFRDAADKLRDSLSDREDQLLAKGVASYVASSVVSGGFEVLEGAAVLGKAKKDNSFAVFLKNYLGKERKV